MANTYLHGAYGTIGATQAQNAVQAGTIPAYFGTAPIHLVRGYADKGLVNRPIRLTNFAQASAALGYSDDWGRFTLCEVMTAHFNNPTSGAIGPVYVFNVLDPDTHRKSTQTTQSLTFANNTARFSDGDIILDTFAIADKADGVDYSLTYDVATKTVTVRDLTGEMTTVSATYYKVDTTAITAATIVGSADPGTGAYSGISALPLLYSETAQVATLLAAPGWSDRATVYNALVAAAQKMNGKFYGMAFTDIALDSDTSFEQTIGEKTSKSFNSKFSKPCWPQAIDNEGHVFHVSTLAVACQQAVDFENNSIPGETCSNKTVHGLRQYFGADATRAGFDKEAANELNENGITTVVPENGSLKIWGGHTGAYKYGATTDALDIFDTNIRMLGYIVNSFVREWGPDIDAPMTLQKRDEILNREQEKLNALVARGYLIGAPEVTFTAEENPTTDIINGDFHFSHIATVTPQMKSVSATVSYTDAGFTAYFENA